MAAAVAESDGASLTLGVRPQGLSLGSEGVPATVVVVEELGSETFVFVEIEHLGKTDPSASSGRRRVPGRTR